MYEREGRQAARQAGRQTDSRQAGGEAAMQITLEEVGTGRTNQQVYGKEAEHGEVVDELNGVTTGGDVPGAVSWEQSRSREKRGEKGRKGKKREEKGAWTFAQRCVSTGTYTTRPGSLSEQHTDRRVRQGRQFLQGNKINNKAAKQKNDTWRACTVQY